MYNRTRVAIILLLVSLGVAFGQYAEFRAVRGKVTFRDGEPVRGATVQLKNLRTLEIRSYVTKDDGLYHFEGLAPNDDYQLRVEYHGKFGPEKNLSQFNSRKEATIDLKVDEHK